MAVKERSQIKGTDAQIKAFAGHNGVLAFATDTKSLHVLSGTAGTTTEFLPSTKVATKTELANYTPTTSLAAVATSGSYNDLSDKPVVDSALSDTSENTVQNKVINSALNSVSMKADNSGYQVGDIKLYAGANVPSGWFRCDGSTIADMATNYPKLYAVLGTNVLPNYSGRVPLGASSAINTAVEAGLPNIEGSMYPIAVGFAGDPANQTSFSANGAFFNGGGNSPVDQYATGSLSLHYITIGINASRSNPIYGKSTTVQPTAVKVAVLIKHD